MAYQLLEAFRALFSGQAYLYRRSNLGDWVAMHFYEDLHAIGRSTSYVSRVDTGIAIVGINRAPCCTSYEGERAFSTDGGRYTHPIDEADEAEARLVRLAAPAFDEFVVLRFIARNEPPIEFAWANEQVTTLDYGAVLARVSQQYEARF